MVGEPVIDGWQFARHRFIDALFVTQSVSPIASKLLLFNKFKLYAIGAFKEHHSTASRDGCLLKNLGSVTLQAVNHSLDIVGIYGDVLDTVFLVSSLSLDMFRYIQGKPMQVQSHANVSNVFDLGCTKRVDVELGSLLRVWGL